MEHLRGAAGKSSLDVVAWLEPNGRPFYHIKLRSTFELQGGQLRELKEFGYPESDWVDCLVVNKTEPWMELLMDLMEIASARAFSHVMDKLLGYDEDFGEQQAARWDSHWNRLRAPTVSELLLQTLRTFRYDSDGRISTQSIQHPDCNPRHKHLHIVYPCGHSDQLLGSTLRSISPTQCLYFACLICNQRILDCEGRHLLDLGQQKEARALFLELYSEMQGYETELNQHSTARSATMPDTATVLRAVEHALVSLQAPKSVTPRALCPGVLPEMRPVLAALRCAIQNEVTSIDQSPYDLYETLMYVAGSSLGETNSKLDDGVHVISPRFRAFLRRWIRRAVAYAVRDRDAEVGRGIDGMVESLSEVSLQIERGETSSSFRG